MVHSRWNHACTTFSSALHDGRPIIIVAGSGSKSASKSAEILDFTKEGTSWQKSNLILILCHMWVFLDFQRRSNECVNFFPKHFLTYF